ncbi:MAG: hypothetical protein AAF597_09555 [Bacteroidota bacterium]
MYVSRHLLTQLTTLGIILSLCNGLNAQQAASIPATGLSLLVSEGEIISEESAIVFTDAYDVSFVELKGVSFNAKKSEFDSIEAQFALQGIDVQRVTHDSIAMYDAISIQLNDSMMLYQVVFGDNEFMAIANFTLKESLNDSIISDIEEFIGRITFQQDVDPILEHSRFSVDSSTFRFDYKFYNAGVFIFEDSTSGDALTVMQLPLFNSNEGIINEIAKKMQASDLPLVTTVQEEREINGINGYLSVLDFSDYEDRHMDRVYLFATTTDKLQFVFQLLIKKEAAYNSATIDNLIKSIYLNKE